MNVGNTPPAQLVNIGPAPAGSNPETTTITMTDTDSSLWTTTWKKTISDLVVWEEINGQNVYYAYYITESPVDDYITSYEVEQSTGTVIITNKHLRNVTMPATGERTAIVVCLVGWLVVITGCMWLAFTIKRKKCVMN